MLLRPRFAQAALGRFVRLNHRKTRAGVRAEGWRRRRFRNEAVGLLEILPDAVPYAVAAVLAFRGLQDGTVTKIQSGWHAMAATEVARHFSVDPASGLDETEAAIRLRAHGPNRPTVRPARGVFARFFSQLIQPLVLVLIAAGTVTALLRAWVDAGVIFGVVLVNAIVGFIQEGKAETALAALARSVAAESTVLRAGARRALDAADLVPGDVVILAAGNKVPADLRLLGGRALRIAEAALSGESVPVEKHVAPLPADTPLADRSNMLYSGTLVVAGHGSGVVVAIGDATEVGRISRLIAQVPGLTTPLTRKMDAFARRLLWVILGLAAVTFAVGILRGESILKMFMAAVALAVGAIPEGLPAAMVITLAIGVSRMAARRAIIRRLPAVETLGSTTVICSDKTGTLTENAMTVREVWAGGETFAVSGNAYDPVGDIRASGVSIRPASSLRETLLAGILCNDARLVREEGQWKVIGDPTEGALLVLARKGGLDESTLTSVFPRLDELSFDSNRQYMATLHEIEGARIVYVKGAVEKLLPACTTLLDRQGHEVKLDAAAVHAAATRMAESGLRVLAVVRSTLKPDRQLEHASIDRDLVFLGLVGMIDPPRPGAIAAVRACHTAGIRVKMITGDHPGTAIAIARQLGIVGNDAGVLTGRELAGIADPDLARVVAQTDVFARVEPEQKLRLVRALQANGEVVAMTGDGVNDSPALKAAGIGIAMGGRGTDVARESAALVLLNDDFSSIVRAVRLGRRIFDNIKKAMAYIFAIHVPIVGLTLVPVLLGWPLVLYPVHIVFLELIIDPACSVVFEAEPEEANVMDRPPRDPHEPLFGWRALSISILQGVSVLVIVLFLFAFFYYRGYGEGTIRAMTFTTLIIANLGLILTNRSWSRTIFQTIRVPNRALWLLLASVPVFLGLVLYVPFLKGLFLFEQLKPIDVAACFIAGFVSIAWFEVLKYLQGRRRSGSFL